MPATTRSTAMSTGGRADQAALIYNSPVTGTKASFTYRELRDRVAAIAGMIAAQGVGKGDRVIIYMPMIPEAVMAMLACARLGAVHSVVFGGFAAKELASRIDDCNPKLVLTASCGVEPDAHRASTSRCSTRRSRWRRTRCRGSSCCSGRKATATMVAGRDLDWDETVKGAKPHGCVPVQATDPLYILYTSGTTGYPKGVVRDTGGYCVALALVDEEPLRREAGRGLLVRVRRRLGGRSQLHRLRPADLRRDDRSSTKASRSARPTPAPSGA